MPLDERQVRHVAELARLKLTDDEAASYTRQLSDIMAYVEKLSELDTGDTPPTAHPLPVQNVYRADVVEASIEPGPVMDNAPDHLETFFRVPKVLE